MAVYTELSEDKLKQLLGICEGVGTLVSCEGVAAGSINSTYRVTTSTAVFYLRINEGKEMPDLVYEKSLLLHLARHEGELGEVRTPRLVANTIGGYFFPVASGKYAMLFEELKGREIAVFEVGPEHTEQVGGFLARAHAALHDLRASRSNPYSEQVVRGWIEELRPKLADEPELLGSLERAFADVSAARAGFTLPEGVIHGDLFLNNAKWQRGRLDAVFDWEMAGTDRLALDVAVCLNAWCYKRTTGAGPAGYDAELARGLLRGYQAVRPLDDVERRGLYPEARFAALRFTVSRVRDFHVRHDDGSEREFLDYRDYEDRLIALDALGPAGFTELVFGEEQP